MKCALILLYISEIIISCQSTKENENTNGSQTKIIVNHEQYMDIYLGQRLYLGSVCIYVCTCAHAHIVVVPTRNDSWSGVCCFCPYAIVTALCWNPS